ncbi:MAG: ECF transporter S component [Candidatus Altiarchaeota archaeon]
MKKNILLFAASTLLLAAITYMRVSWTLSTALFCILVSYFFFQEFESRFANSRVVALLGVYTGIVIVSRQIFHGLGVSPIFPLIIIAGYVFGAVNGFIVGSISMFLSNFFVGGHGPWTPYQMFAAGLVGFFAAAMPKPAGKKHTLTMLLAYSVFAAYLYGLVTDIFWWLTFTSEHTLTTYLGIASAGLPMDSGRAVGNVIFLIALGPPLIKVLLRFRKRFQTQITQRS